MSKPAVSQSRLAGSGEAGSVGSKADGVQREQTAALPIRRVAVQAAGMWLVTRVALLLAGYFSLALNPPARSFFHGFLGQWRNWDANWFYLISTGGYAEPRMAGFFPLYPTIVGGLTRVFGTDHWTFFAMTVSNIATLAAFVGIGLLAVHEERRDDAAPRAIRMLAAYPFAYYLIAPFSEGPFVAFVVFTLLFARRGAWRWAALMAFLAGLTRAAALALVPFLAWEYARQHDWWHRDRWRELLRPVGIAEAAMVVAAVPAGYAVFGAYLWRKFGDPLLIIRAHQVWWYRTFLPPWQTAHLAVQSFLSAAWLTDFQAMRGLDIAVILLSVGIILAMIRRVPFSYTVYVLATVALITAAPIPAGYDMLLGVERYLLAAIPLFLILARWVRNRPTLDLGVVAVGFLLQAMFITRFFSERWLA